MKSDLEYYDELTEKYVRSKEDNEELLKCCNPYLLEGHLEGLEMALKDWQDFGEFLFNKYGKEWYMIQIDESKVLNKEVDVTQEVKR